MDTHAHSTPLEIYQQTELTNQYLSALETHDIFGSQAQSKGFATGMMRYISVKSPLCMPYPEYNLTRKPYALVSLPHDSLDIASHPLCKGHVPVAHNFNVGMIATSLPRRPVAAEASDSFWCGTQPLIVPDST